MNRLKKFLFMGKLKSEDYKTKKFDVYKQEKTILSRVKLREA
jgi:hypothetical protein